MGSLQQRGAAAIVGLLSTLGVSTSVVGQDLGNTLDYVKREMGPQAIKGYESRVEKETHEAVAMLATRDLKPGAPLSEYDCEHTLFQAKYLVRDRKKYRAQYLMCDLYQFNRDKIPGYVTLGDSEYRERDIMPWINQAARRYRLHPQLLLIIAHFSSGLRPGVVAEWGQRGLMGLSDWAIQHYQVEDPLDARQSIWGAARYLRHLIDTLGGLKPAIYAYRIGLDYIPDNHPRKVISRKWAARVSKRFSDRIADIPADIASEAMAEVIYSLR